MAKFREGQLVKINPEDRELSTWQKTIRYRVLAVNKDGTYDLETVEGIGDTFEKIEESIIADAEPEKLILQVRNNASTVCWLWEDEEGLYTKGQYGEGNRFSDLIEVLKYLQEFDIHLDDIFFE